MSFSKTYAGPLVLLFVLMQIANGVFAKNNCLSEKKVFLENLIKNNVDDFVAFSLPPDNVHDVITAMPTKELGIWFELRFRNGELDQVRKVSALETVAYDFDAKCTINASTVLRTRARAFGFTDQSLQKLLNSGKPGVLYTISPGHILSEESLPAIRENAKKYNLQLTLLTDPTISKEDLAQLRLKYPDIEMMESIELIYRGMFNHFPSTLLYKDKKIIGRPMLGARASSEIDTAFSQLLTRTPEQTSLAELSAVTAKPSFGVMKGVDSNLKKIRTFKFPSQTHPRFVRSIPGSENILIFDSYKGKKAVLLYDTMSEKIIRTWKNMTSPYVSADGKLVLFMDDKLRLVFQDLAKDEPFFMDTMPAWYPAISVLKNEDGKNAYRVITRMMDLKVQDYEIDFNTLPPSVKHLGEEHRICTNFPANATPYISRYDGDMFTLIQPDNSRQLVRLLPDNTCETLMNLGFWTWKATFSYDDQQLSFTAVRVNSMLKGEVQTFKELFSGHSFIYDRSRAALTEVPGFKPGTFSYPEFRSDGSIIVFEGDEGIIFTGARQ